MRSATESVHRGRPRCGLNTSRFQPRPPFTPAGEMNEVRHAGFVLIPLAGETKPCGPRGDETRDGERLRRATKLRPGHVPLSGPTPAGGMNKNRQRGPSRRWGPRREAFIVAGENVAWALNDFRDQVRRARFVLIPLAETATPCGARSDGARNEKRCGTALPPPPLAVSGDERPRAWCGATNSNS